jgi:hypothetical protein
MRYDSQLILLEGGSSMKLRMSDEQRPTLEALDHVIPGGMTIASDDNFIQLKCSIGEKMSFTSLLE